MKKLDWTLSFIICFNLLFFTFCFAQKNDLHVDEIFSFGQANSTTGAYLFPDIDSSLDDKKQQLYNRWFTPDLFFEYMTVQQGDEFSYLNVIQNLAQGVHPPFFHMMLHTVSSFFPNHFSIWQGYILNLPILALLLIVIYKLAFILLGQDKKMARLALIFCGFSLFVLNMAIYIRMYLLWMCLSTTLIYFTLKILLQDKFQRKEFALVGLMSFLCFLTHMYALPFVFFLTSSTCLWLACQKKWRLAFQYGGTILLALLLAYACFPYLLKIMFCSSRGEQFQELATHLDFNIFDVLIKLERFFDLFFSEIFNFPVLNTVYFSVFFILAFAWGKMQHIRKTPMYPYAWWMFSFALPYVVFLSFFSPDMGIYDDRYFSPVLIVFALLIFYWLNYFLKALFLNKRKRTIVLFLLVVLNLVCLNFTQRSIYLFSASKFIELKEKMIDKPIVVWDTNGFNVYNLFYFIQSGKKVYFLSENDAITSNHLDEAKDGFLLISSATTAWNNIEDIEVVPIPKKWKHRLDFLGTHQIGIYFYDVYRIRS